MLRKNAIMFGALPVVALAILTGCVSSGRKLDPDRVDQIRKGVTTRAGVLELLGSPDQMTRDGNGNVTMFWQFTKATAKATNFIPVVNLFAGGADIQNQSVVVVIGANGIVTDLQYSSGGTEIGENLEAGSDAETPEVQENKRPK